MFDDPPDYATLSRSERLEAFRTMLMSHASGGSGDDRMYRDLRRELTESPDLVDIVPRWIRTCRNSRDFWEFIKASDATWKGRREFLRREFEPLLARVEGADRPIGHASTLALAEMTDEAVNVVWSNMINRLSHDPEGAITAARSLIETVCKHILDDLQVSYEPDVELPKLYKLTARSMMLAPEQHAEKTFQQVLQGCASIANGLAEVRNALGDAHGKGRNVPRPKPRHARVAVNAASALSLFLIETWSERKASRAVSESDR